MKKQVTTLVTGVATTMLAAVSLTFVSTTAHAQGADLRASAACVSATSQQVSAAKKAGSLAKKAKVQKKKVKKAKKAKKAHATRTTVKKVKVTKKKLAKTRKKLRAATAALTTANGAVSTYCGTTVVNPPAPVTPIVVPPKAEEVKALGGVLNVLLTNLGGSALNLENLGLDELIAIVDNLLDTILAPLRDVLSGDQITYLAQALKDAPSNPAAAFAAFQTAFGKFLDPSAFSNLANFNPQAMAAQFTQIFSGLAGKFPGMGSFPAFDATMITGMIAKFQALANQDALKQYFGPETFTKMVAIFTSMANGQKIKFADLQALQKFFKDFPNVDTSMLMNMGLLGNVVGGLTGGAAGLPGLGSIPFLGPVLTGVLGGVVGGVCIILPIPFLCTSV